VTGEADAVTELRDRLAGVGRDTLAWTDPTPVGSVFTGEVTGTLGSGAVVDLGPVDGDSASGFLPYDRVEGYVDEGDSYRFQVASPEPPWSDDRPTLATDLRIPGNLVELRRGGGGSMSETPDWPTSCPSIRPRGGRRGGRTRPTTPPSTRWPRRSNGPTTAPRK